MGVNSVLYYGGGIAAYSCNTICCWFRTKSSSTTKIGNESYDWQN